MVYCVECCADVIQGEQSNVTLVKGLEDISNKPEQESFSRVEFPETGLK
jgi:hypothetical protein